jgi:F-type H+-transporting ATPase subunit delta
MKKGEATDLDPTIAPSVFDIDVLRVARVYASALLQSARKVDKVDLMQDHFDELVPTQVYDPEDPKNVATLLRSSAIPRHRKEQVITDAFKGQVDELFLNFLFVLNKHDRLELVRPVAAEYRELRDQLYNRVRFQVRSAVKLTEDQKKDIAQQAAEHFKMEPVLVEIIDPELIGGLQIQVGDTLYDLSLKTRLDKIKQQLLARSSHEIQRRRDRLGAVE